MSPGDPMSQSGARWCEQHARWECNANKPDHHASAIRGRAKCRHCIGEKTTVAKAKGEANLVAWSLSAAAGLPVLNLQESMLALIHVTTARHAVYAGELRRQYEVEGVGGLVGATWAVGRGGESVQSGEQLRGLAKLEGDERDRLARYLKSAHDMGIATAAVELAQGQAQIVVSAALALLESIKHVLTPADRDAALRAFLGGLGRGQVLGEIEAGRPGLEEEA